MKRFLFVFTATAVLLLGATWAAAKDKCNNSNPCGDKEECKRLGDLEKSCRRTCCSNTECSSGESCYSGYCVSEDEKSQLEQYYGKAAAAARAAELKDAKDALDAANVALKAAQGDVEKTRLALLKVLEAERLNTDLDMDAARAESTEAYQTWLDLSNAVTAKGAGKLLTLWNELKTKKDALDTEIKKLPEVMAVADGLIRTPDAATSEKIQASILALQNADGNLKVALSELQAAHKAVKAQWAQNLSGKLDAEKKKTAEAEAKGKGLNPNEIFVRGGSNITALKHTPDKATTTGGVQTGYRRHFNLDGAFRPYTGGGAGGGTLPDSRFYYEFFAELGFHAGSPESVFFWDVGAAFDWMIGMYESSGQGPAFMAQTGPGFNLGNKGKVTLGPQFRTQIPSSFGTEENVVNWLLQAGTTF
ncbi:MAG: hypothetical protein WC604_02015 [Candidatus Gracilibacteria bacterium]